ncbi:MAG: BON domain-containing protein [Thioalkalivibrionaceae bacterium]
MTMKNAPHLAAIVAAAFLMVPAVHAETDDQITTETSETIEAIGAVASDAGRYLEDASITARVNTAFVVHSHLSGLAIAVETSNGVVTLSGTVESDAEKALAEGAARDVSGVNDVHNAIEVE